MSKHKILITAVLSFLSLKLLATQLIDPAQTCQIHRCSEGYLPGYSIIDENNVHRSYLIPASCKMLKETFDNSKGIFASNVQEDGSILNTLIEATTHNDYFFWGPKEGIFCIGNNVEFSTAVNGYEGYVEAEHRLGADLEILSFVN